MILIFLLILAVLIVVAAVVLIVRLRKTKEPAKIARIFSFIALAFAVLSLIFQMFFPEYSGPKGIDYIGDAIVYGFIVLSINLLLMLAYLCSAVVTTVFAVKAFRKKPDSVIRDADISRKDAKSARAVGVFSLILCWIYAVVFLSFNVAGYIKEQDHINSIKVDVKEVTNVTDFYGNPAVLITIEVYNGTKADITYLTEIYDDFYQNGNPLYSAALNPEGKIVDTQTELIKPGSTGIVKKAFKVKSDSAPIKMKMTPYGSDHVYFEGEIKPK